MTDIFYVFGFVFSIITVLSALLFIIRQKYNYAFFIYLLVFYKTNLFSSSEVTDYYLEPEIIIGVLILVTLLFKYRLRVPKLSNTKHKILIKLIIVLFIFQIIINLKSYFLFQNDELMTLKTLIKLIISSGMIVFMILYFNNLKIKQAFIENGIIWGTFILAFQSLWDEKISKITLTGIELNYLDRISGFSKADENEFSSVILIVISFILAKMSKSKKQELLFYLFLATVMFVSVLLSGSRTALIVSSVLIIQFIFQNTNAKLGKKYINNKFSTYIVAFIIFTLGVFLINRFGMVTTQRLEEEKLLENIRVPRMMEYIQYLINNPLYIITGALKEIRGTLSFGHVAHNIYIQSIYDLGIFSLFILLRYYYLLIRKKTYSNVYDYRYAIIIYLLFGITLSTAPLGYLPYIILISEKQEIMK